MPRKNNSPVSSFGPELLAALLRGGQQELRIPVPNFNTAFALRQRFYALRKAMRSESHEQLSFAMRASIPLPLENPDGTATLVIRPHDDEFSSLLRKAGVSVESLEINPLAVLEVPEHTDHEPQSDWLSSLLSGIEIEKR